MASEYAETCCFINTLLINQLCFDTRFSFTPLRKLISVLDGKPFDSLYEWNMIGTSVSFTLQSLYSEEIVLSDIETEVVSICRENFELPILRVLFFYFWSHCTRELVKQSEHMLKLKEILCL